MVARARPCWLFRKSARGPFRGNPTGSYRSRHPLRVVAEVRDWQGHHPEVLSGMLANLQRLREQGLDVIED